MSVVFLHFASSMRAIHESQRSQWSLPWSDLSGLGVGLGFCVRVGECYVVEIAANKV